MSERKGVESMGGFDQCIETKLIKGDLIEIHCRLGRWAVSGHESQKDRLRKEAFHYWRQYFDDGEYNDLLFKSNEKTTST